MTVSPSYLLNTDTNSQWYGAVEIRWRSSTSTHEYYGAWDPSSSTWWNSASHHAIKVGTDTSASDYNTWTDGSTHGDPDIVTESAGNVYLYNGSTLNAVFVKPTTADWITSGGGSSVTVTDITIYDTPQSYNDGVNVFLFDGEIVSSDTIVASDVTLTKDGVAYANSNISVFNNKFEITKSGDAAYGIECGGIYTELIFADDTWRSQITSGSSTRSTNSLRIRNVIAKVPDDLKMYVRFRTSGINSPISGASWTKWNVLPYHPFYSNFSYTDHDDIWLRLGWAGHAQSWTRIFQFQLANMTDSNGNNQIGGNFRVHRFSKVPGSNRLHFYSTTQEIGSSSMIIGPIGSNDPNYLTNSSADFFDEWFYSLGSSSNPYSANWEYQLAVDDWIYHQEPEGDDTGPPDDPDPPHDNPKHQYPGDWPMRRRRAHSFW